MVEVSSVNKSFTDTLEHIHNYEADIMRVVYMDKMIWERKEYMTFDEARRSGKMFRHKDQANFMGLRANMTELGFRSRDKINELLDSKEWEVTQ